MGALQEASVALYYSSFSPFLKVKKSAQQIRFLLTAKRIKYEEFDVYYDEEKKKELAEKGCKELPALFINNKLIGGYEQLQQLEEEEKLNEMLREAPPAH